jgi:hypothetical protein
LTESGDGILFFIYFRCSREHISEFLFMRLKIFLFGLIIVSGFTAVGQEQDEQVDERFTIDTPVTLARRYQKEEKTEEKSFLWDQNPERVYPKGIW